MVIACDLVDMRQGPWEFANVFSAREASFLPTAAGPTSEAEISARAAGGQRPAGRPVALDPLFGVMTDEASFPR